jgi:hypothetical protein
MSFLSALDFQKRPAAPDFKNQPETARCLFDFCEKRSPALFAGYLVRAQDSTQSHMANSHTAVLKVTAKVLLGSECFQKQSILHTANPALKTTRFVGISPTHAAAELFRKKKEARRPAVCVR